MARQVKSYLTRTAFFNDLVTFLIAAGWTNDGAPAATILKSAADTEGRRCYVLLSENGTYGSLIDCELGNSRNGDTVETVSASVPTNKAIKWETGKAIFLYATDRMVAIKMIGASTDYVHSLFGILECPVNAATYPAPLIYAFAKNKSDANVIVNMDRYGSSSNIFVMNAAGDTWRWCSLMPMVCETVGTLTRGLWNYMEGNLLGNPRGLGPAFLAYQPWWVCNYDELYIVGYMKDVYLVHNYAPGGARVTDMPVIIGTKLYYSISDYAVFTIGGIEEGAALFFPGGTY